MKNENGITLVSLIVAIIILLILAGVSIFSLSQTNLLKKAKNSENTMKNAQIDENLVLCNYENKINEIVNNSTREHTSNVQQPNSQNTVSGEEHFTGEYFFNGKPIYEKTIYISSLSNTSGQKSYNHGIINADEFWFNPSKSFAKWNHLQAKYSNMLSYPTRNDNQAEIFLLALTKDSFTIDVGMNRSGLSAYVTINYTKTTDSSNGNTISPTPAN